MQRGEERPWPDHSRPRWHSSYGPYPLRQRRCYHVDSGNRVHVRRHARARARDHGRQNRGRGRGHLGLGNRQDSKRDRSSRR